MQQRQGGSGMGKGEQRPEAPATNGPRAAFEKSFDMVSRPIDKMHIVDARRARCHASEAGKTAVDMFHGQRIGGPVVFEHVLNEVDSSARAIEFVASSTKVGQVAVQKPQWTQAREFSQPPPSPDL